MRLAVLLGIQFVFSHLLFATQEPIQIDSNQQETSNSAEIAATSTYILSADDFKIVQGKGKTEEGKIEWAISHEAFEKISGNPDYSIQIRFVTAGQYKGIEMGLDGADWNYIKDIPVTETSHTIKNLNHAEKYHFGVGIAYKDEVVWSSTKKFETERAWGIIRVLILVGALGFFIYGMKIMSEGIQKAAGKKLRNILNAMTGNSVKGIFTGFITTSLVQSSSATTVMIVSFVNAGLLNLKQAIGVIMGANIGTTVTSWLIVIFGFGSFKVSTFSLPVIAIAIPFLFSSKSIRKSLGEFMVGFAILFMGLQLLQESVPDLKNYPDALAFIQNVSGTGIHHILLAVLIGTIVTIIVQSSSAAMAITLILCNEGFIPFEMAAGMVLGENVGTTITANLAALIGNKHAKRAARAHFLFNIMGVIWMVIVFKWFLAGIEHFLVHYTAFGSPFTETKSTLIGLSVFHTAFNILNVLILVWFTNLIAKLVEKMVPDKAGDDDFHLEYIQGGVMSTPELSILEAQKEVAKYGEITSRMSEFDRQLLTETDDKEKKKLLERIAKYEEITDRVEIEIGEYLSKVTEQEVSDYASRKVRSMLSINNDLERIGDIFFQMSKTIERKDQEKIWFTPEQRTQLLELHDLIDEAFAVMRENMDQEPPTVDLIRAVEAENKINKKRDEIRQQHLQNIENKEYNVKSGMIYNDLFSSLEKIGDHIINVSEALAGKNLK
jgi:phosphate:Na+ symporter